MRRGQKKGHRREPEPAGIGPFARRIFHETSCAGEWLGFARGLLGVRPSSGDHRAVAVTYPPAPSQVLSTRPRFAALKNSFLLHRRHLDQRLPARQRLARRRRKQPLDHFVGRGAASGLARPSRQRCETCPHPKNRAGFVQQRPPGSESARNQSGACLPSAVRSRRAAYFACARARPCRRAGFFGLPMVNHRVYRRIDTWKCLRRVLFSAARVRIFRPLGHFGDAISSGRRLVSGVRVRGGR